MNWQKEGNQDVGSRLFLTFSSFFVESWLNSIPTSQVNLPTINCFLRFSSAPFNQPLSALKFSLKDLWVFNTRITKVASLYIPNLLSPPPVRQGMFSARLEISRHSTTRKSRCNWLSAFVAQEATLVYGW